MHGIIITKKRNRGLVLHFCMRQSCKYLWDTVFMSDHTNDVIQGEQGVTLDLGVDVLALGTQCQ